MKVSIVQMDMVLGDVDKNYQHAEELFRKAAEEEKPDVIMFCETWTTGFFPKDCLEAVSDNNGERIRAFMGKLAKEYGVNVVAGSEANKKGDHIYNTAFVFNREGECIAEYDKVHAFSPSGEDEYFKKGDKVCMFELDGKKCGIIICYDVRFPELIRKMSTQGMDILFVPAQWPAIRTFHWTTLNTARAIENQMFVCANNSCASDTKCGGNSRILDPWGNTIVAADDKECIITGELDFSVIEGIRTSINVFRDRRPDVYGNLNN